MLEVRKLFSIDKRCSFLEKPSNQVKQLHIVDEFWNEILCNVFLELAEDWIPNSSRQVRKPSPEVIISLEDQALLKNQALCCSWFIIHDSKPPHLALHIKALYKMNAHKTWIQTHHFVAEMLGSYQTSTKESSVTCSFLARLLDMVERLAIVNGVLDDLLICETG